MSEKIDVRLDESTELIFKVAIEAPAATKPSFRYVCETRDGMSLVFDGSATPDGNVSVTIPPLKNYLKEGRYTTRLEVIIDGKYFAPIEMQAEFTNPIKVHVESVTKSPAYVADNSTSTRSQEQRTGPVSVSASVATTKRLPAATPKRAVTQLAETKKPKRRRPVDDVGDIDDVAQFVRDVMNSQSRE